MGIRWRLLPLITLGLLLLFMAFPLDHHSSTLAQDGDDDACFIDIQIATEIASASCTGLNINEVCYGFGDLSPIFTPTATNTTFQANGDRVSINDIQSLSGSSNEWSVALIALQNPAPDAPIPTTFALLGNAQITDANITEERGLTCPLLNNTPNTVNVRAGTSTDRDIVGSIQPSESITAIARNQLGDWVQITLEDGVGWVYAPLFETECDVFALSVVDETTVVEPPPAPFETITLTSSTDATCQAAPNGLLVYTVTGFPIEMAVNGVNLHVDGGVYLSASNEEELTIHALEGEITASTADDERFLLPQYAITVTGSAFSEIERDPSNEVARIMVDVLLNGQSADTAFAALQPDIDASNADIQLETIECIVGESETVELDYSRTLDFNSTITATSDGGMSILLVNQATAWVQCNQAGEFDGLITITYGDGSQETIGVSVVADS